MTRIVTVWLLAMVSTVLVSIYQRTTGPTYPLKIRTDDIKITLPRSSSQSKPCVVTLPGSKHFDHAKIVWRYFPGDYSYDTLAMTFVNDHWQAVLPTQPPAGKLQYYVELYNSENLYFSNIEKQAIIRFKGDVPSAVLIPHILFMLLATMLSFVALYMVLLKKGNFTLIAYLTVASLAVGGLLFGPIVQKFAFGEYWTGFPFGMDLTDNKTLLVFLIWLIPIFTKKPEVRKKWIVVASLSMLAINSIPHSTLGSELNRDKGKIETGGRR